jgi:hypothetical protein
MTSINQTRLIVDVHSHASSYSKKGTKLPRLDEKQVDAMIHRDSLQLLGLVQF